METAARILNVICTFSEAFFWFRYADLIYSRRYFKSAFGRSRLVPGGGIVIEMVITLLLNRIAVTSPYTVVVLLLVVMIYIYIFWDCNPVGALAVSGGYVLLIYLVGIVEIALTGMIGGDELIRLTTAEEGLYRAVYLVLCGLVWLSLTLFLTGKLKKVRLDRYSLRYTAVISAFGCVGFLFIGFQLLESYNAGSATAAYAGVLVVGLVIFSAYYLLQGKALRQQLQLLETENELLLRNYQQISDTYTKNAKLYHDMDHHLAALYYMMGEKDVEAKQYIESLREPLFGETVQVRSGIDVIDVILSEMEKKAAQKGVSMEINVPIIAQNLFVEKKDLCALTANLLQNAVEASTREVRLTVKCVHKMLLIRVVNDYSKEPVAINGKLQTGKADKTLHGWGTQNIAHIVNKYHGTVHYEAVDGKFTVEIMMEI